MARKFSLFGASASIIKHGATDMVAVVKQDTITNEGNYGQGRNCRLQLGIAGKCRIYWKIKDKDGNITVEGGGMQSNGGSSVVLFDSADMDPALYSAGSVIELEMTGNMSNSNVNVTGDPSSPQGWAINLDFLKGGTCDVSLPFTVEDIV